MPKGLQFSGFDGGSPGVIIRKFNKNQSKTLPVGLYIFLTYLVGVTILCWSKAHLTINCNLVNTHRSTKLSPNYFLLLVL